ncbi:MAG TPA: hypothetical protein VLQ80_30540 [Candidatus Saccharimonadia bacterium]|nr:hypothetical protein [Candidatus Saccharimonadia bacterium]
MDSAHPTDDPAPVPAKLPCPHVWTQLTPTTAQCQRCQFTVPTLPAPSGGPPTPEAES